MTKFIFRAPPDRIWPEGLEGPRMRVARTVLECLEAHGALTTEEIRRETGLSWADAIDAIAKLERNGFIALTNPALVPRRPARWRVVDPLPEPQNHEKAPMNTYEDPYSGPVCRGSWVLGTACGKCERCEATRPVAQGGGVTVQPMAETREDEASGEQRGVVDYADVINALCRDIHASNVEVGWWPANKEERNVGEILMLIVSEIAEGMEGHRKNLMDDKLPWRPMLEVELADALIRIFDLAGAKGYDLGGAIVEKRAYNAIRSDHKLENRMKPGGKKY